MTEEKTHREFDKGSMTTTLWNFDGIRMGHAVSQYNELTMQHDRKRTHCDFNKGSMTHHLMEFNDIKGLL